MRVPDDYPNRGRPHGPPLDPTLCQRCGNPDCTGWHGGTGCQSEAPAYWYHQGGLGAYRAEFTDGAVTYVVLCGECAEAGGQIGRVRDLRRTWFLRWLWFVLTKR